MTVKRFIIIDDDSINNKLCKYLIVKASNPDSEILEFLNAENAFKYISQNYTPEKSCHTVVLLDINMPEMNGWEFLAMYENLPANIHNQIDVYMLSSSVDSRDRDRAEKNAYIRDFLFKPLRLETILSILSNA